MNMKKNLNDIAESPPPPLSYQQRMKSIHQEERKALLYDIGVNISTVQDQKKTTQLASKRLIFIIVITGLGSTR